MSLAEISSLFEEDSGKDDHDNDLRVLMDLYVASTDVEHTPENGYLNDKKINEIDRFQIVKMVQDAFLALSKEQPGILGNPRQVIEALHRKGASIKVLQLCLELTRKDIEDLAAGFQFPYHTNAWKAVFGDLEQKIANRRYDSEEELLQSTLFCGKDTPISRLQKIHDDAHRKFEEPEGLLRYVTLHRYATSQGITPGLLARVLYMSLTSLEDVLNGTRPLSNSGIQRVNRVFNENFPLKEKGKRISPHRRPLCRNGQPFPDV